MKTKKKFDSTIKALRKKVEKISFSDEIRPKKFTLKEFIKDSKKVKKTFDEELLRRQPPCL